MTEPISDTKRQLLAGVHDRSGFLPRAAKGTDLILVIGLAVVAFLLGALAWPLYPGRDAQTYLMYYLDIRSSQPVFPQLMLFRTPVSPLFYGLLLQSGGSELAEVGNAACFLISIVAYYFVGCYRNRGTGIALAVILCLYPAYGALYHHVSSDGLFGTGIALWALLVCATVAVPTSRKFAINGVAVFLLTMIRPSGIIFLGWTALLPVVLKHKAFAKLQDATVILTVGGALLLGWATYNKARYDDFTISRGSPANMPLPRVLTIDRIVRPENGPASLELARAIESDLLQQEPYRSYGVTLQDFLSKGRIRMLADLSGLSDRTWGWTSDYGKLRAVSREAIMSHPGRYAFGVAKGAVKLLAISYVPSPPAWPPPRRTILCELGCFREGSKIINGRQVPLPAEPGEPIPTGHTYWLASTPDNSITTDWSILDQPRFRFSKPEAQSRFDSLSVKLNAFMEQLPSRQSWPLASDILNSITALWPSMLIWLVVGIVGLALRPEPNRPLLLYLCASAILVVMVTSLGLPSIPEYRVPVDPLIVLFGIAGLTGHGVPLLTPTRSATHQV